MAKALYLIRKHEMKMLKYKKPFQKNEKGFLIRICFLRAL
jgi:hypothetical protein